MRIELEVELRNAQRVKSVDSRANAEPHVRCAKPNRGHEERWLRRIALARCIVGRIDHGCFESFADAARICGVSRARVSAIADSIVTQSS